MMRDERAPTTPEEIEELMQAYREPAIMLYRPYPPVDMPPVGSHLGGHPALPTNVEWPRSSKGLPLHFLARIDCAELPKTGGILPDDGVLFFFTRIGGELDWGKERKDECRVVYVSAAGEREASPPSDCQSIEDGYSRLEKYFSLPGDPIVNSYPRWPITFHGMNSWPNMEALPCFFDKELRYYQRAVDRARAAEVVRVLGLPIPQWGAHIWAEEISCPMGTHISLPLHSVDKPFPEVWIMVDRISRYLLNYFRNDRPGMRTLEPELFCFLQGSATKWIAQASQHGLGNAVIPETAKTFCQWLKAMETHRELRSAIATSIIVAMQSTVQFAASAPSAAALIPPPYFHNQESDHIPATASKSGQKVGFVPWAIYGKYHQMLGNAGSPQHARSVQRDDVLLLQLYSDKGVNFMFCDLGVIEFWIHKNDLAARRFDQVFVTSCGG